MGRTWIVIVLIAGCGRFGFDDMKPGSGDPSGNNPDPIGDPGDPGNAIGADSSIAAPVLPTAGLVAYWDFDNLAPGGAMSSVGDDLAACSGAECPTAVAGVVGTGAQFDGATSCLHVPTLASWHATALTMSAWVKVPDGSIDSVLPVITRDFDGCPSPGIQAQQAQIGFMFMGEDSVHYHAWTAGLTGDTWHQLGVRWDGTTETVFVDGVCACDSAPGQQIQFDGADYEIQLGCDTYTPTYVNGVVDEVRIYDRALSDDEMASLVTADGRTAPTPQSCAAACEITTSGP